jgi:hypothetical protein
MSMFLKGTTTIKPTVTHIRVEKNKEVVKM